MQVNFWKDKEKKIIDPTLFNKQAEKLADDVFAEKDGKKNNPTQLRKFYDEVLNFSNILKSMPPEKQESEFDKLLPYIMMLNSKAAYAEARDLISKNFKDFISNSLKQVETKEDFEAFLGLFEAFMGFYKYNVEIKGQHAAKPNQQNRQQNRPEQGQGNRR